LFSCKKNDRDGTLKKIKGAMFGLKKMFFKDIFFIQEPSFGLGNLCHTAGLLSI